MPNPPLSEEERKRRKQALNRKRSHADVYKRKLEKEKSLMDKLTEDQRVEQRRLTALRRSAENARAYRKRTIADHILTPLSSTYSCDILKTSFIPLK